MNRKRAIKFFLWLILSFTITLGSFVVHAQPPALPHAFYGGVMVGGEAAPAGTEVQVQGDGVQTGIEGNPLITEEEGQYGGPGGFDPKLLAQGNVEDGTSLTFYVDGMQAECAEPGGTWQDTYPFESGAITELNLRVEAGAEAAATEEATLATEEPTATATATEEAEPGESPTPEAAATEGEPEASPTLTEEGATAEPTEEASPTTEEPTSTTGTAAEPTATEEPSPTEEVVEAAETETPPEEEVTAEATATPSPDDGGITSSRTAWIFTLVLLVVIAGIFAWLKMRRGQSA